MAKQKIFFKIVTAASHNNFSDLEHEEQRYWIEKSQRLGFEKPEESYQQRSGIYAEFSNVIGVGLGVVKNDEFRFKFVSEDTELKTLEELCVLLNSNFSISKYQICGYNLREFDIPFLSRRLMINNIELPEILKVRSSKPWDYPHLEILDFWKFGDYKSFIPIGLMCKCLGVDYSPAYKSEDLHQLFFQNNREAIESYCYNEVVTISRLFKRFSS